MLLKLIIHKWSNRTSGKGK